MKGQIYKAVIWAVLIIAFLAFAWLSMEPLSKSFLGSNGPVVAFVVGFVIVLILAYYKIRG
ncbi:MAG: hypothetical protein HYW26_05615 [Candidatus Aenigmarchaeota archaeon]|nr:hypothetical protein [Candidatus Aenigmarchaeota archaeon]